MGRFPQEPGVRGSQKWIQKLINEKPERLNYSIEASLNLPSKRMPIAERAIRWLSPLKDDKFAEYRDQAFLDKLSITLEKYPLSTFWPNRGPQWDALGKRESTGEVFLIEAKSHIPEVFSSLQASTKASKDKIIESLNSTKQFLGVKSEVDWTKPFYQYTNRLAHLHLLRKNGIPAYLVFVCFLYDREMNGPFEYTEWKGAFKVINRYLGLENHTLSRYVADVFINVNDLI